MRGLFNAYYLGDSVLLEPIARKLKELSGDEVAVISAFSDLYIGHPEIKSYTLINMPEGTQLLDMSSAIKGEEMIDGQSIPTKSKLALMCQTASVCDIDQPRLYLTNEEQQESFEIKKRHGGVSVGVVVESRHHQKDWKYMPLLVKTLSLNYHTFVIGQSIRENYPYLKDLNITYLDNLSLRGLMTNLSALDLVVGVDTGPMHIAGALGVPTVVVGYEVFSELYTYKNSRYIGRKDFLRKPVKTVRDFYGVSVQRVYGACRKKTTSVRKLRNDRIGIMLLEGLGGTVTLSDHAKKVYDYCGRKPYLIIRTYRELFENNPYIEDCIEYGMKQYDVAIPQARLDFDTLAVIKTGIGKWYQKKHIFKSHFREFSELYKNHPLGSIQLEKYGLNLIQTANKSLGLPYKEIECGIYNYGKLNLPVAKDYIIVSNGVDTWHKGIRQTKSWEHSEWERLADMVSYPIIQVGTEFDVRIEGTIDFRQMTTIPQLLTLLKNAKAVVCTEGGLMHLSYAVGNLNTFVLRGPTKGYLFSYPNQHYIDSRICEPCYWSNGNWYKDCPKGLDNACMKTINAERVYAIMKGVLGEDLAKRNNPAHMQLDGSLFRFVKGYEETRACL